MNPLATMPTSGEAPSLGQWANSGNGPQLVPVDIGHARYMGLVDPETAFWSLIPKERLAQTLGDARFLSTYSAKSAAFAKEIHTLRFGIGLSAVYVNATERCNLNCTYCYIPEGLRKAGTQMDRGTLLKAMGVLRSHFETTRTQGPKPQIIFHGAEPMLCRDDLFEAIEQHKDFFRFGVQTNGTLLDEEAAAFLKRTGTGVGLSLDAPEAEVADLTRMDWGGQGVFPKAVRAMQLMRGYDAFSVICTVTSANMHRLSDLVSFFHEQGVPTTMLNMVRCTLPGAREIKPQDHQVFPHFEAAIKRSHRLYQETGRKLVVANFANILLSILAPSARRLMCDISPCGGGRVFFALAPDGGMYPCSEFIGLPQFKGGNLFTDAIPEVLASPAFTKVTGRKVEDIQPCSRCVLRHFCGSPCPAEAHEMNGGMNRTGAFCGFYEEQARLALRLIADGVSKDFLWDDWDRDTTTLFDARELGL